MKTAESHQSDVYPYFKDTFGKEPNWVSVAPGRVNLIGEHTDYNLLPVLPMSIDKCIRIYGSTRDDARVQITNTNGNFPTVEINLDADIEAAPGLWSNYIGAAFRAVIPALRETGRPVRGFDALVDSDLPGAAGLSSSSALVIASCLALLHSNDVHWTMHEVAERMRLAEQFVGTAGGGMDQAAISLGQQDSALLIEFDPLKTTPVTVPSSLNVFIINSGQRAEKTGSARFAYNRRALECAVAVEMLRSGCVNMMNTSGWKSLRDVYRSCTETGRSWSELVLSCIPVDPPTLQRLLQMIDRQTLETLCKERQLELDHVEEWLPGNTFQIHARAAHVLSEARRVYQFMAALEQDRPEGVFHLARASHISCRDLYHISTPGLERLISTTRDCGASAARITGAGFGGCIVAFVPAENAADLPEKLQMAGVPAEHILRARSVGPASVKSLLAG
jgi:N-acetylgalactosamine kinase